MPAVCLVPFLADMCPLYAAQPGEKLWEFASGTGSPTATYVQSSPAIGPDGTVYVGSNDGRVYALASTSVGGLARSPWPKFRRDAQNTGRSTARLARR